jgi:hypothetical protein
MDNEEKISHCNNINNIILTLLNFFINNSTVQVSNDRLHQFLILQKSFTIISSLNLSMKWHIGRIKQAGLS